MSVCRSSQVEVENEVKGLSDERVSLGDFYSTIGVGWFKSPALGNHAIEQLEDSCRYVSMNTDSADGVSEHVPDLAWQQGANS